MSLSRNASAEGILLFRCHIDFIVVYDQSLEEEIKKCVLTHDFIHLMESILKHVRDETGVEDVSAAEEQAKELCMNGISKFGVSVESLNEIMAYTGVEQLRLVFEEYRKLTGQPIFTEIRRSWEGDLGQALLTIGMYYVVSQILLEYREV